MTQQRQDFLFIDGQPRRIAAAAPMPFVPVDYELRHGPWPATNCYRCFSVDYEVVDHTLQIREMRLSVYYEDLPGLIGGRMFARAPDETDGPVVTYRKVPLSYSGILLIDAGRESPARAHEQVTFRSGRLTERKRLQLATLPDKFTPSSHWVDYGEMLWLHPVGPDRKGSR